jgi:hypothetical protein
MNVNPDAEVVPTGNAKIRGHAAITDIVSIGGNVLYPSIHVSRAEDGEQKASLRHQGNEPSDRNAGLVVVESVEHLLIGISEILTKLCKEL